MLSPLVAHRHRVIFGNLTENFKLVVSDYTIKQLLWEKKCFSKPLIS